MAGKTIVLCDADLIAFKYSAATESTSVDVIHKATGRSKVFKNKTAFKDYLKNSNFEYVEDHYHFVPIQEPQPISVTVKNIERLIGNIFDFTWADKIEYYLGGGETFRHKLALPTPYKDNREETVKPIHLSLVREWFVEDKKATLVNYKGLEADDVLNIRAYEVLADGDIPIIATADKDSWQAQGCHVLDYTQENWNILDIPDVGILEAKKTKVVGTGLKFLAQQVLAGDPADTYQGYQLSNVYYGQKTAMKALVNLSTEQQIFDAIVSEYKRLYPEPVEFTDCHGDVQVFTWKDFMEMYFKCAYMKRSYDDPSDIYQFANSRYCEVKV